MLLNNLPSQFLRIKKSLPKDHTNEGFKVKLEKMCNDLLQHIQRRKGLVFDAYLKDMWETITSQ